MRNVVDKLAKRFLDLAMPEPNSGCWLWMGPVDARDGYGRYARKAAYRFAYEAFVGDVPPGLVLDHRCNLRICVNPEHLRPVTNAFNVLRGKGITACNATKTHCGSGHELSGYNLIIRRQGWRACRACLAAGHRKYKTKRRAMIECALGKQP